MTAASRARRFQMVLIIFSLYNLYEACDNKCSRGNLDYILSEVTMQSQMTLNELERNYGKALADYGLSYKSQLTLLQGMSRVFRVHENNGEDYLRDNLIADYTSEITERYNDGLISRDSYYQRLRELSRFINFVNTGDVTPTCTTKGCRSKISRPFFEIAEEFISTIPHANSRNDARWVTHKYFLWLEGRGHKNLSMVGASEIQKFLLDCSKTMAQSSIHNIKLYAFLYVTGRAATDYEGLLSFTVNRETKIYPTLPRGDVAKLLDSIDRKTRMGKRNYAIMLLGTVLGLRACDIIALKKTDIDWQKGEIKITQSKTGNTVVLPLTEDVGQALSDYILNARLDSCEPQVFLRVLAPYRALSSAVAVGEIYESCCKKAGLPVTKRFHNLRRSLATAMVTNGVSVYDVAQELGDRNIDSVKPYIGLDTQHLKVCALPFDGIEPKAKRQTGGARV